MDKRATTRKGDAACQKVGLETGERLKIGKGFPVEDAIAVVFVSCRRQLELRRDLSRLLLVFSRAWSR